MKLSVQQGIILFIAFLFSGCGLFGSEQKPEWENLNFPVQTGYKLFFSDGDLFVAAGYDGLYFLKNADPENEWKYLGHKVTEGERHAESGVQAINVYKDTIIIGYIATPEQENGARVGIWRSEDLGKTWTPSDEGIRTEDLNFSSALFLSRSPHDSNRLVTSSFGEIYYSENGGISWKVETSSNFQSGSSILEQGFKWHPQKSEVAWSFGENGYFQPFLAESENLGESWKIYLDVQVPRDNAFFDMAFDAFNPDLIYVGAQGAVIKSETGGEEWKNREEVTVAFTDPNGGFFQTLETHPEKVGVLFAAAGPTLYLSRNEGRNVQTIKTPDKLNFINDIIYDKNREVLYVTGEYGVFRAKNIL